MTHLRMIQDVIEGLLLLFTRPAIFQLKFSKKAEVIRDAVAKFLEQLDETPPLFQFLPENTSKEEKLDHATSLMLAGVDTLSSAFTWSAGLLAQHPQWMDSDDPKIISAIASESLRLYPSVWSITRNAITAIDLLECSLPSGTRFVAPLTVLHRHPHFWKNPDSFDPDRFIHPEPRSCLAYAPFGIGGFSCLGLRFAMVALETYVSYLIHTFRLIPASPLPQTRGSVTLACQTPLLIKAESRANSAA